MQWQRRVSFIAALGLALGLAGVGLSGRPAVSAAASAWSEPVQLSPEGGFSWFPDILADLKGQVHVVYASGVRAGRTTFDAVMYTTRQADGTWSTPNDIEVVAQGPNGESAATRPTLLVDASNTLHLAYTDYYHIYYAQAPAEHAGSAQSWTPARDLGSGNPVYFSRLLQDHHGRLHLLFTENVYSVGCPQCYHVFYRQSDDHGATWSQPVDISLRSAGSAKVQFINDQDDNLYAVWETGRGGSYGGLEMDTRVQFAASYDRGRTWSVPIDPNPLTPAPAETLGPTPTGPPLQPTAIPRVILKNITLGLGPNNQLLIVWLGLPEDLLYAQTSGDGGRTWSDPAALPGVWGGQTVYNTRLDDYALAGDSAGQLHLLVVGRREARSKVLHVLHMTWDGVAWSAPESLAEYQGDVPEWPRLTTQLGNTLHAVWFVRNVEAVFGSDAASARYQVWYADRPLDTPALELTLAPRPTARPVTPTPAGGAAAATSAPLLPTPHPIAADAVKPIGPYGESDYLLIAGASLLPVLALIGIAVIVQWRRRR